MAADKHLNDPGLPIKLGPCSNGEYPPQLPSEVVREAMRRARIMCDENARRRGMDRRTFLLSSMGAATTLFALAACSSDSKSSSGNGQPGGTFEIDEEATVDPDAALETLGSDQPVIDVQTHLLEYPNDYEGFHLGEIWEGAKDCGDLSLDECFSEERWQEEVFLRSDTTLAILSALPVLPGDAEPLSAEVMDQARENLIQLCGEGRVMVQGHAWVNVGELPAALDAMEAELENYPISAWKTYTHVGGGFMLDDSAGLPVGEAYLAKVEEIGPPIVCVHKGFGNVGDAPFADPVDIGPAATNHPDLTFCIYHSGYEIGVSEGPYDPNAPNGGVDRLVKTLEDHGIEPGSNVYAELGSTWRFAMGDPDQAAHILGKLLLAVGEDRILWGTDSIWYGSPQDQIQALRSFSISEELQEEHGYPELTDEIKHKILWRNAALLHDIEVSRLPCRTAEESEEARLSSPLGNRTYGPRTPRAAHRLFRSEHPWAFWRT
jgi:predicted TIM-barrel fold metal-dependent hydrolase